MRFSGRWSFNRIAIVLLIDVLALSWAGRFAASDPNASACAGWPFCIPATESAWFRLPHIALVGLAGILAIWILMRAWQDHRDDIQLLPLTTVTVVLFMGQVFLGAVLLAREFRPDLVILHAASAVALWISILALVVLSRSRPVSAAPDAPNAPTRSWRDFLALGKPWIVGLLLVTTFGGMVAGGAGWPRPSLAAWTLLGGALAAAGSSALNQYIDRELDKNMQRTARRPLPAGRVTAAEGLSFGLALCLASYYVLAGMVNFASAVLSLAGILYYVVVYSILLKKATVQNIVVGGGAGAIPPMVGWAAAAGHLSLPAWILFLIIFMWTPPHFWALAIVRMKDYARAGIPMLPVVKGERAARLQILIYTVLLVCVTLLLPLLGAAGLVYLWAALLLGILLIAAAWRVWRVPGNNVAWIMYRWSSLYLMLIFAALVVDSVL